MKIAHIVWGMETGGVETMLVNIINEQVKTETVALYIINDFINESIMQKLSPLCKVIRINRKPHSKNILKIIKLNVCMSIFNPDIVHIHSYRVSRLIFGRRNIVRTIHGLNNIPIEYPRMKALYAISDAVRDFTIEQGFMNVTTVENGILTDVFKKRKNSSRMLPEIFHFVQVSRLYIIEKGQDLLVEAMSLLRERGVNNFIMHFIGSGESESMLKNMVKEKGLNDYVVFEGNRTQDFLHDHLCDYDLFIQPSRNEGFGLTIAEAVAAGLPVLVSNLEGPMEIIGNGRYGMSFECGNIKDLADKLQIILDGGYDYSLTDKAYRHIVEKYDVRRTAKRYIEEYKKILS